MSNLKHPDLEIYIKSRSPEDIINWLQTCCDELTILNSTQTARELEARFNNEWVKCTLQLKVSGKAWSSLWFKNNATHWLTDLDCALQASAQMQTQIRCIKAGWSDTSEDSDSDEDQWWRVENGEKALISWLG